MTTAKCPTTRHASTAKAELKDYRKRAQLIFQDPYAALSPRMTVRDIIAEPLEVMKLTRRATKPTNACARSPRNAG
jgi:ABC-type microcin C transport system duplicated ATPase subunit YejF